MSLSPYQHSFVDFLVHSQALLFGEFTLKSGRKAPYFINTGKFNSGEKISKLGAFYAAHIAAKVSTPIASVFGPAYKGIPLAVATAAALFANHALQVGFTFDRKESKDHGDAGKLVGMPINPGDHLVIVEDVITAGTTLRQVLPYLRDSLRAVISAVVIAVDRCERGTSNISALAQIQNELKVEVFPLVNIHQIIEYLSGPNSSGLTLDAPTLESMRAYLKEYGA